MDFVVGWEKLPSEVKLVVLLKLRAYTRPYGSARRVCKEWCQVLPRMNPKRLEPPAPSRGVLYTREDLLLCSRFVWYDEIDLSEFNGADGNRIEFLKSFTAGLSLAADDDEDEAQP